MTVTHDLEWLLALTLYVLYVLLAGSVSVSAQRDSRTQSVSVGPRARGNISRTDPWELLKPAGINCVICECVFNGVCRIRCGLCQLRLWELWWREWVNPASTICCRGSWRHWRLNRALWIDPVPLKVSCTIRGQQRAAAHIYYTCTCSSFLFISVSQVWLRWWQR